MLDRNDELELLGLIEGELDAPAEAALRKRLAKEPKALQTINEMKGDRAALRALPDPELPVDFLVQIESLLARPMLMEAQTSPVMIDPGDLRRHHRRQTHRIRWGRLAMAATFMLGTGAAILAFANGLISFKKSSPEIVARNDKNQTPGAESSRSLANRSDVPPMTSADGTIHHYQPLPIPPVNAVVAAAIESGSPSTDPTSRHVLVADFEVVIHTTSDDAARQLVQRYVEGFGDRGALVRNFSFAEAARIDEAWRLAHRDTRPGNDGNPNASPRVAGTGSGSSTSATKLKDLAEHVRQHAKDQPASAVAPADSSGQLAGLKELAPSLEQQLDFSSRGATLTVTVPARQLQAFIQQLGLQDGQATALRLLPPAINISKQAEPTSSEIVAPALQWMVDGPKIRASIARLSQLGSNDLVLIPISVQSEPSKKR